MKKGLVIVLLVAVLLVSCGQKVDPEIYADLQETTGKANTADPAGGRFVLECRLTDKDGNRLGMLYCMDGRFSRNIAEKQTYADFTVTYLGATAHITEEVTPEKTLHYEGDEVLELSKTPDETLLLFPFCDLFLPNEQEIVSLQKEDLGNGSTEYTLQVKTGQKRWVGEILGLDLYELAEITVPDSEKETYGTLWIRFYTDEDGTLTSASTELTVTVYEKAAYTPGHKTDDEDNRLDLVIYTKRSFTKD